MEKEQLIQEIISLDQGIDDPSFLSSFSIEELQTYLDGMKRELE